MGKRKEARELQRLIVSDESARRMATMMVHAYDKTMAKRSNIAGNVGRGSTPKDVYEKGICLEEGAEKRMAWRDGDKTGR
jgi:hypothetical protein